MNSYLIPKKIESLVYRKLKSTGFAHRSLGEGVAQGSEQELIADG